MTDNLPMISGDAPMGLDPKIASQLSTWEEWLTYFLQLGETVNSTSWIKADLLVELEKKFGGGSLEKFASDVNEPRSTVTNYVRVAKAFPIETRIPHLSFTHHYQASFADSYDENKKEFATNTRFILLEEAASDNISTRQLKDRIHEQKEENKEDAIPPICEFCKKDTKGVREYCIYSPGLGKQSVRVLLHEICLTKVLEMIKNYGG